MERKEKARRSKERGCWKADSGNLVRGGQRAPTRERHDADRRERPTCLWGPEKVQKAFLHTGEQSSGIREGRGEVLRKKRGKKRGNRRTRGARKMREEPFFARPGRRRRIRKGGAKQAPAR